MSWWKELKKIIEKFEQNYYSRTAKGIYRIGHNGARFFNWMAYYEKHYENNHYFVLMGNVLSALNEVSEQNILCRSET